MSLNKVRGVFVSILLLRLVYLLSVTIQAPTLDFEELMNLSTFDWEGALVIPLYLDPLTS